jgi:hypothetical protein
MNKLSRETSPSPTSYKTLCVLCKLVPAIRILMERALAFVDKLNRKRFGERIVGTFRASGASKNGAREARSTDLNANPGSYHKVENSEFPGRRRGEK